MSNGMMNSLFKSYLSLVVDINRINTKFNLHLNEIVLLDAIDVYFEENSLLSVGETISWESIASPATLHCTLKKLLKKNMLVLKTCSEDGRKKYIEVGPEGKARQKLIHQAMSKLLKASLANSA